ncbi:hypothetical protein [Rhizobium laguerreae]|uniref:hypothetical protein n=1 Tax=Rhizobium laguerreae TaxID=1076926 RepID=UPI001441883A|nr:hypothetical protein [Rhizobium laguerreae]NKM68570.1 hypothetical protein [Rhizobium laguerreae]
MEIIIIGLLAFAGYALFRHTTKAGREAVRGYVYLEALNKGVSPYEANAVTDAMLSDIGSDMAGRATDMARKEYRQVHHGKQLAVIGFAYKSGMRSTMPFWYTALARSAPQTMEVEFRYGRSRSETAPENLQQLTGMVTDEGYKSFCETFCDEVNRLAGKQHFGLNEGGILDGEDLYRVYKQGEDAWVAAAMYCHEHGINRQVFTTYESYRSAFASELLRLASDPADLEDMLSTVDNARLHTSFKDGTHPRLAAVGYHEFISQPQRT